MKLKKQYDCNLVMMNDLIGGKWKLRILWHIMNGDNRFSMLEKNTYPYHIARYCAVIRVV